MAGKAWGRREDGHYDFLETEVTGHLKGLPNWSIFISLSLSLGHGTNRLALDHGELHIERERENGREIHVSTMRHMRFCKKR